MKKTTLFIIIIALIIGVAIPFTYILFEDMRPAMGDFFGGLRQSATVVFVQVSTWFVTLPYWPALLFGIGFVLAIIIDRWAWGFMLGLRKKLVSTAIRDTGLRPQTTPYQRGPAYSTPNPTPKVQPTPNPTPKKTKTDNSTKLNTSTSTKFK